MRGQQESGRLMVVLSVIVLAAPVHGGLAQAARPADGAVVEMSACPPRPTETYEQYVAGTNP